MICTAMLVAYLYVYVQIVLYIVIKNYEEKWHNELQNKFYMNL